MDFLLRTPNLGTGVVEDRDRINFAQLRRARRDRTLGLMDSLGLDALVLGREANVRYVSGARRLWTAQSRPFGPTCVVLRGTGQVHLLSFSASYEGIPEELQPDQMYPLSWNPVDTVTHIRRLPGAAEVRVAGVDGLTPFFHPLLAMAFPGAQVIGVQPQLSELRRVKLEAELVCIRTAAAIAEAAMVAAVGRIRPGVTGQDLQGAFMARMCVLGTSQFAQQGFFAPVGQAGRLSFETTAAPIPDRSAVVMSGGVLFAGYEGSLARTWWCGRSEPPAAERDTYRSWQDTVSSVVDGCRPGASGAALLRALSGPSVDRLHSAVYMVGLGYEGPVAASWLPGDAMDRQLLAPGVVLAVRALVRHGSRAFLGEEMVLVTPDGPERLTTLGHGPLAE